MSAPLSATFHEKQAAALALDEAMLALRIIKDRLVDRLHPGNPAYLGLEGEADSAETWHAIIAAAATMTGNLATGLNYAARGMWPETGMPSSAHDGFLDDALDAVPDPETLREAARDPENYEQSQRVTSFSVGR